MPVSSRFRVLQVVGSLDVGGAEMMLLNALRSLPDSSVSFDFLVFGDESGALETDVRALGSRILRAPLPRAGGPWVAIQTLSEVIRREGPYDVVHSHINLASGMVLAAAHRADVPRRVAHAHITRDDHKGLLRRGYRVWSERLLKSHSTQIVACGQEAGEHLFGKSWLGKGVVIPNGVEVDRFIAARSERDSVRHDLGVAKDTLLAGAVARLVPFKNHQFMLEAMRATVDQDNRVVLLIAGDGPLRSELEGRVDELDLREHVRFLGLRSDVPQLLAALDVILMPSHYEGLPVSLVEAQAAGVPSLVSDKVTTETDLGLGLIRYLPITSVESWRSAILAPLPNAPTDEQVRAQFASRGYDAKSTGRRLLDLYGVL